MPHEVLLRRCGAIPNASVRNGPGSAAHHFVLRCARDTGLQADLKPPSPARVSPLRRGFAMVRPARRYPMIDRRQVLVSIAGAVALPGAALAQGVSRMTAYA